MSKLFPDTQINLIHGRVQESGNSVLPGAKKNTPQRWIKVDDVVYTNLDDGLYQARYGDTVIIAFDSSNHVVGYYNKSSLTGSSASQTGVIGAVALMLILTAIGYYGGVWNFIWKGFDIWWLTIFVIFCFGMYALVWTPIFAFKESKREKSAHQMIEKFLNEDNS